MAAAAAGLPDLVREKVERFCAYLRNPPGRDDECPFLCICREPQLRGIETRAIASAIREVDPGHRILAIGHLLPEIPRSALRSFLEKLAEALIINTSLTCLYLRWRVAELERADDDDERVQLEHDEYAVVVAGILEKNRTIEYLVVDKNNLGSTGATIIAGALARNTTLRKLDMDGNNLGAQGCRALVSALAENSSLESLFIKSNSIGDEGCKILAGALREGKSDSLKDLHIGQNGISDVGCNYLASALRRNCSLVEIDLSNNPNITPAGVLALEMPLRTENYSVVGLKLDGAAATVTNKHRRRIRALCENNKTLKELFIEHFQVSAGAAIPLSLWPKALEVFIKKPGLLFLILRARPDLFKERQNQRRRRRPERLTFSWITLT